MFDISNMILELKTSFYILENNENNKIIIAIFGSFRSKIVIFLYVESAIILVVENDYKRSFI